MTITCEQIHVSLECSCRVRVCVGVCECGYSNQKTKRDKLGSYRLKCPPDCAYRFGSSWYVPGTMVVRKLALYPKLMIARFALVWNNGPQRKSFVFCSDALAIFYFLYGLRCDAHVTHNRMICFALSQDPNCVCVCIHIYLYILRCVVAQHWFG